MFLLIKSILKVQYNIKNLYGTLYWYKLPKFKLPEVKDAISRKPVGVKSRKSSDNCVFMVMVGF